MSIDGVSPPSAPEDSKADAEVGPGVALFRFIRHWARRAPRYIAQEATGSSDGVRRVLVADIIAAAQDNQPGAIVDVRLVAEALGVDRSVASRMVTEAVQSGLVERGISVQDSRHAALNLTDEGRELVVAARRWQEQVFDAYTDGWDEDERRVFARLLVRFVRAATVSR